MKCQPISCCRGVGRSLARPAETLTRPQRTSAPPSQSPGSSSKCAKYKLYPGFAQRDSLRLSRHTCKESQGRESSGSCAGHRCVHRRRQRESPLHSNCDDVNTSFCSSKGGSVPRAHRRTLAGQQRQRNSVRPPDVSTMPVSGVREAATWSDRCSPCWLAFPIPAV